MDDSSALVLGSVSGLESESESESVALTEKERRGLGERSAWGLEEEEANGVEKGFGSCRDEEGTIAILLFSFSSFGSSFG